MSVQGEFNQTYQLAPDANVEVSGLEGPVEVETTNGNTAEVHLSRSARTQADYDADKTVVEQTPTGLLIRRLPGQGLNRVIIASERLKLVVPHSVNLAFRGIEGDLTIGQTDGMLRLDRIEGYVRIAQARSARMRGLEKGLSLNVATLREEGINISRVEGAVELSVTQDLNADLSVRRYSGEIETQVSNAQVNNRGRAGYFVRFGSGGAPIVLSGIEGNIRIHIRGNS